jgi:hypothetical protein
MKKRTTTKKVQASEKLPPNLPNAKPTPEVDDDPWDNNHLTLRHRRFIAYYVGEAAGNATKAARLAGYRDDNYDSLRVTARRVLTNANVQRVLQAELSKGFGTPEQVRNSIATIANGNAADYLEPGEDGKLKVSLDRMADNGALGQINQVEENIIETTEGGATVIRRKLKLYDRLKALELLAKMNGQLVDKHEVNATHTYRNSIIEAMARLKGDPQALAEAQARAEKVFSDGQDTSPAGA